ncbi:family 16 glycosylhydrolase [Vibrio sp. 10N]|uniref:family 16 glycosylhydrolase n=1 Tax=Vibrio sp. 10N TaxID=3058938 RepID=UPI002812B13A|nr:hypothetical protein VB10N_18170 [Vibrio sp. 10N]
MNTLLKLLLLIPALVTTACTTDSKSPFSNIESTTPSVNSTDKPLYGAEVFSHDKVLFGKFVIRMKMVSKPGVISSFFTYDNESWVGGLPWREIDIESVGKQSDLLQTNLITGEANNRIHSEQLHTITDIDQFHEYTLIWTPEEIRWQVDGVTIHQELATQSLQVQQMRDTPQSYRMNLWVADSIDWAGRFNSGDLPLEQTIDWIEYHSYENGEFRLMWRDDFNYFDSNRWGKANWSFAENLATFRPENAVIVDDTLVLRLTR